MKKGDAVIILSILIIAGSVFVWKSYLHVIVSKDKIAVIMHDGHIVNRIDLNRLTSHVYIKIEEGNVVIEAEKGRIRFLQSNCKDKICIKAEWLNNAGEKAICIPFKTQIMILGENREIDSLSS